MTKEVSAFLRNRDNYDLDVRSKNPAVTGVAEKCIFSSVPNYHVCDCPSLDFMHDVPEGVGNYTMVRILNNDI